RQAGRGMPGFPDVPGAARRPGPGPARAGTGPGDGPGPGRTGPRGPHMGRVDGPVQPAGLRGGLRLDGDPDVPGRARAGPLAGALRRVTGWRRRRRVWYL